MRRIGLAAAGFLLWCQMACAQDVPGIEHCIAESRMDRRTSCLQSNVNYLHQLLTRNAADTAVKLKAAGEEIVALKTALAKLQASVDAMQAAASKPDTKK